MLRPCGTYVGERTAGAGVRSKVHVPLGPEATLGSWDFILRVKEVSCELLAECSRKAPTSSTSRPPAKEPSDPSPQGRVSGGLC